MRMQSELQRILSLALIGQAPEILFEILCTLFQHRLKMIPGKDSYSSSKENMAK
jgi:hypothetical protein